MIDTIEQVCARLRRSALLEEEEIDPALVLALVEEYESIAADLATLGAGLSALKANAAQTKAIDKLKVSALFGGKTEDRDSFGRKLMVEKQRFIPLRTEKVKKKQK
jgi:hypothetical protein